MAEIFVLYNPNSTGDSKVKAEELVEQLSNTGKSVELIATEYAGHARELAAKWTSELDDPLIVSSSGDGGYNEVVNGVMSSGGAATCAVLPAGNANDHRRTVAKRPLAESIIEDKVSRIDVLQVSMGNGDGVVRYAHSYAGLGITPTVAIELNRNRLSRLKETLIVAKSIRDYQPFQIRVDGVVKTFDSLIFANIAQMAKVLTIAENAEPDDGLFEVVEFPFKNKPRLLGKLALATVKGIKGRSVRSYEFELIKDLPMQLDGEVEYLKEGAKVTVRSLPKALRTIL